MTTRSNSKSSLANFDSVSCWLLAMVLLIVPFLAFFPAIQNYFIWDDNDQLTSNIHIQSLKGLAVIWLDPSVKGRFVPDYCPLTYTTFALENQLWGLKPMGYHVVNILLQGLNAILVWRLLKKIGVPGSFLAALLFAVHPMNVETVAWITERKNLLSGFFYLAAALCFFKYVLLPSPDENGKENDPQKKSPPAPLWYGLSLVCFVCAMLSKPLTMTLAVALLVVLWWKNGRLQKRDILLVLPYFLLLIPFAVLTMWLQQGRCEPFAKEVAFSFFERLIIAGGAIWFYVGTLLCPWPLSFTYPRWTLVETSITQYLPAVGALVGLALLWPTKRRPNRAPFAAALFLLVTLFPSLGFFNVFWHRFYFVADHIVYLAMIGPLALLMAWAAEWIDDAPSTAAPPRGSWKQFVIPVLALVLAGVSFQYCFVFRDPVSLWSDVFKKDPYSAVALNNLGEVFARNNMVDKAVPFFEKSLELRPGFFEAHLNLGVALGLMKKNEEANKEFLAALEIMPTSHDANLIMGGFLAQAGKVREAVPYLEQAVKTRDSSAAAQAMLGKAYLQIERRTEAREHLLIAQELGSTDPLVPAILKELEKNPTGSAQP